MIKFTDLNLDPKVLQAIADAGYETPTPIQAGAIPPALEGKDVLGIAQQMAVGERLYKSGDYEAGLDHLRAAANYSDNLHYDEPWGWMQPPRHALAALLMEQKQYVEAEEIYRADLGLNDTLARPCQHPKNIWSLHGLSECPNKRGENQELVHVQLLLDQALARAEVPVSASCYCRNT